MRDSGGYKERWKKGGEHWIRVNVRCKKRESETWED